MGEEYESLKLQLEHTNRLLKLNEEENVKLTAKRRALQLQLDALAYEQQDEEED